MRTHPLLIAFVLVFVLALGCRAEEPPECDFEDGELECTCDNGNLGMVTCNDDGTANCICDAPAAPAEDAGDGAG